MRTRCGTLGCGCGCHRAKVRQVPRTWTPLLDQTLTEALARGGSVPEIADRLRLTQHSVRWRVRHLGLSTRDGWRSRREVAQVLGVSRRAVDRWWHSGLLRVELHGTRWTRVTHADLRAFVSEYAGVLVDHACIADPALRSLAETAAIVHRRRAAS